MSTRPGVASPKPSQAPSLHHFNHSHTYKQRFATPPTFQPFHHFTISPFTCKPL